MKGLAMLLVLLMVWWLVVCVFNLIIAAEYGMTQRMASLLLFSTLALALIIAAMR
jgi:hypothetical protein